MTLIDCHNHSNYSFDAEFSVEVMCGVAQQKGLDVFAITDHCDVNYTDNPEIMQDIAKSIAEVHSLKNKFPNIKLIAGVELGQPLQNSDRASQALSLEGLDFVIGSLHNAKGNEDFYDVAFSEKSNAEIIALLETYYLETQAMASSCDFDVLGHLTYPFRYLHRAMNNQIQAAACANSCDEIIFEALKTIVSNGKGIEINTSGLKDAIRLTLPSEKYLKMYYQLGGEILSVGSDAHKPEFVGFGIAEGIVLARSIGFKYLTYFEKRKPIMVRM